MTAQVAPLTSHEDTAVFVVKIKNNNSMVTCQCVETEADLVMLNAATKSARSALLRENCINCAIILPPQLPVIMYIPV